MRFLMLNWRDPRNPKSGGAERVSAAYLSALLRRGHEVAWFANTFPGAAPEETVQGIRVLRGGGSGTSILAARRWYREQPRFDLVIDQHHGIPWYAPWWCGTHTVAYIHEVLGPIWEAFYPWPVSALGRWQERLTHRCYSCVPFWTPSESTRVALQRSGVKEVKVLLNGVDTRPLPALEPKPLTTPLRLVAVSRLAPNKRVDHAIHLLHCLATRKIAAELRIVGSGESEAGLRQLASQLAMEKQITFTGQLSEQQKEEELRRAHFLVHASIREGWGLNVIEANAMGTPALVYPVAGLVDSVVAGQTGIVVAEETPECLADALAAALARPDAYASYRQQAWARARSLQWDQVLPPACDWLEQQARGTKTR